jgi:hypothetical protein
MNATTVYTQNRTDPCEDTLNHTTPTPIDIGFATV